MRRVGWPGLLIAAAVLMMLATVAAKGGSPLRSDREPRPAAAPAFYSGWIKFDVVRSWSKPDPQARVAENDEYMFVQRVWANLSLTPGGGSNPPKSVRIESRTPMFYLMSRLRVEPVPEMPDMCLGHYVVFTGFAKSTGYSGAASGSNLTWQIPGIGYTVYDGRIPDILFLGGNCEPGRSALEESSLVALQVELGLPAQTPWTFTEGLREPASSATPRMIEGSCDSEYYDGRIQCQWQVWAGAPALIPPRRR